MTPPNVSAKVVLFKGKVVEENKHPLMLQVKTGKSKYNRISLGITAQPKDWIPKAESFAGNQHISTNHKILEVKALVHQILEELQEQEQKNNISFSFEVFKWKFVDAYQKQEEEDTEEGVGLEIPRTLFGFLNWYIKELTALDRIGDRMGFKSLKSVVNKFTDKDILLDSVNKLWLEKFKIFLSKRKNRKGEFISKVTVWTYLKNMRTLLSKARYYEVTSNNPFRNASNPSGFAFHSLEKTPRISRSMSDEELTNFIAFDYENANKRNRLAYLCSYLIYLFRGIPISDLALLNQDNIHNNQISFGRVKTHKKVPNIPLTEKRKRVLKLLAPYTDGYHLVPILHHERHITKQQKFNRIEKIKGFINTGLKEIAKQQGISINLTTYTFRHTYSRKILEKYGVWKLKEVLGHESILTTQKYAGSLSDKEIAMTDDVFDDVF